MSKTQILLIAAFALILASGAFHQAALAESAPQVHAVVLGAAPGLPMQSIDAATTTAPAALSPITAMGPINSAWPSFCGTGSTCASDPSGSMLIGAPTETWPLATCTSNTAACGEVYNEIETNTASGTWKVQVEVKQGTSVIYDSGLQRTGDSLAAGQLGLSGFYVAFGPGDCFVKSVTCVAPVAGPATITYTNKIGTAIFKSTARITLQ